MIQQKKNSFGTAFHKNDIPRIERVLCPLGHIFNKVNTDIVQRHKIDLVDDYFQDKCFTIFRYFIIYFR